MDLANSTFCLRQELAEKYSVGDVEGPDAPWCTFICVSSPCEPSEPHDVLQW